MSNSFAKFTNFNLNIRGRLIAGFAVLTLLLVAAVGTTLWKVASVETEVNQAAAETGSAAGQVLGAAAELSKQAEALRAEVDKFLVEVRAA
ncbi:MAG: hypothetical protein QGD90_05945 [Candidatus Hydrogenedentes bacterium]|nr:hypothetical protein [Candidatus Hydrogenedentota bacterium]